MSISHLGEGVVKSEVGVLESSGFLRFDVVGCQEFVGDVFKVVGGHRGRWWFFRVVFHFQKVGSLVYTKLRVGAHQCG